MFNYYPGKKEEQPRITRINKEDNNRGMPESHSVPLQEVPYPSVFCLYPCYPCYPWLLFFFAGVIIGIKKRRKSLGIAESRAFGLGRPDAGRMRCPAETLGKGEGERASFPTPFQEIEYESEEFTGVVHYRLFERLRP